MAATSEQVLQLISESREVLEKKLKDTISEVVTQHHEEYDKKIQKALGELIGKSATGQSSSANAAPMEVDSTPVSGAIKRDFNGLPRASSDTSTTTKSRSSPSVSVAQESDVDSTLVSGAIKRDYSGFPQASSDTSTTTKSPPVSLEVEAWPMKQFESGLSRCSDSKKQCVLLNTGAMNPPHRGHAQMLIQARQCLEAQGYGVLSAWMSPSHDGYVKPKSKSLKTLWLSDKFRLHTGQLILQRDEFKDFLAVGAWEAQYKEAQYEGHWPDYPEVALALQSHLAAKHRTTELCGPHGPRVFYVCGTDHASKCRLYGGLAPDRDIGVVVVPREGEQPEAVRRSSLVYIARPAPGDLAKYSSTMIRKNSGDKAFLEEAMSPEAGRFLTEPTKEEAEAFAQDFQRLQSFVEK